MTGPDFRDRFGRRIAFHALGEMAPGDLVHMFNHPDVPATCPLAGGRCDEANARAWAHGKDARWGRNGYGAWAILQTPLAGWGGFRQAPAAMSL